MTSGLRHYGCPTGHAKPFDWPVAIRLGGANCLTGAALWPITPGMRGATSDQPKRKLGPFMAVALLATFYGAAVANLFCLPIADKLHLKLVDEEINRTLIIDGILMIREAKSPTLVREMLLAYLPEKHRHLAEEAEAAPA